MIIHHREIRHVVWAILGWIVFGSTVALAQTTAFTYQGKLTDAGNPASGDFDLQFKLFDTVTPGTGVQQGGTLVRSPVTVTVGVFTVPLDFGSSVFGGADRFLDIGVRPAGAAAAYSILAPRQPVTASPYAIQTLNAQQLDGITSSGFIQNSSSLQVGATFNVGGKGTAGSLDVGGPITTVGTAAPGVAPIGQGRLYFDAETNKVKVSESGGPFVNLVGATGVSGGGSPNYIPYFSAGTTLANSLISQNATTVNLPNSVVLAPTASNYQFAFGSPNGETGLTISSPAGGGRTDLRFEGSTVRLVAGPAGSPPSPLSGVGVTTAGNVVIGTTGTTAKLTVVSTDAATPGVYGESSGSRGVWGKSTGGSRGVYGESATGEGVFGISGPSYGVSGTSTGGSGVYGQTSVANATQAGVYGNALVAGGVGVIGTGTTGIYGHSVASGGIGVTGQSDTGAAIGMYGVSSSGTGIGVVAQGVPGYGLKVIGHATQSPSFGGMVKAMVYIDIVNAVVRCFNSTLTGAAASTPPCGISTSRSCGGRFCNSVINFGFPVENRFWSATVQPGPAANPNFGINVAAGTNSLYVSIFQTTELVYTDEVAPFALIVY